MPRRLSPPVLSSPDPMPTTLPPSVREHFGEAVAEDFAHWLDEYVQENAVERDEYREVLSGLDVLEEGLDHMDKRFDLLTEHVDDRLDDMKTHVDGRLDEVKTYVDGRLDEMETRFKQVDQRFESLETRMDERFEQVDQRFEKVDRRFDTVDTKLDRMNDRILSMTRWLIGLVALFGSLVTALLAVAQFG